MSSVVISRCPLEVVQPSKPVAATGSEIPLSAYDQIFAGPVTALFVFKNPIHQPAETIRRGLSEALVHYYPISGRLAVGSTSGEVVIKCTGEGVSFVAASANCAIKDARELCVPPLQNELALYPPMGFGHSKPLMLIQVTVFSCGGFTMGVTWNHLLCDGIGLVQFLKAVGELTRGVSSPSVIPVRRGDSLKLGRPPFSSNFMRFVGTLQPSPRVFLDTTVSSSLVNHIRHKFFIRHGHPCSEFEAVAAVLWRCRTRAILSDQAVLVALSFMADARKYAGAEKGFYGNCVGIHVVTATSGMVANVNIIHLVKMIQLAKVRVPDMSELRQHLLGYNLLSFSCWRNFGAGFGFGAGGPARLMSYEQERIGLPFCMASVPCDDKHSVMARCVREEHSNAFLQEISNIELIYSWNSDLSKL